MTSMSRLSHAGNSGQGWAQGVLDLQLTDLQSTRGYVQGESDVCQVLFHGARPGYLTITVAAFIVVVVVVVDFASELYDASQF